MQKEFFKDIQGKKVTILGAVRSGIAAAKLVQKVGGIPFVSDMAPLDKIEAEISSLRNLNIEFETGAHTDRVNDAAFIIISPGVPTSAPVVQSALAKNIPIISEIDFAAVHCAGTIIAITGTNGKSTTTMLVNHLLNECGFHCKAVGNIGFAFSEVAAEIPRHGFVSLEVSSFQLDHIQVFKPAVAMLLNITPDHLNRYDNDMRNYVNSKFRIFENQDENDTLILNYDSDHLQRENIQAKANVRYFSLRRPQLNGTFKMNDQIIYVINGLIKLRFPAAALVIPGEHNLQNAMAAVEAVLPFVDDYQKVVEGLRTFPGIEHRIESVAEIDGILYVNDSKATNIDSVVYALRSFDRPMILILGGIDKGNDYNVIKSLVVERVKKIYAIGASAQKVYDFFHDVVSTEFKSDLEDCVKSASREAVAGDILLLSPACASFDMFRNFEHRGEVFKKAVQDLPR